MEKTLKVLKPFVPNLRKKEKDLNQTMQNLQHVLLDQEYAYVTNSHIAVKMKHEFAVDSDILYSLKSNCEISLDSVNYPASVKKFFSTDNMRTFVSLDSKDLQELKRIHELALIVGHVDTDKVHGKKYYATFNTETSHFFSSNKKDGYDKCTYNETYPLIVAGDSVKIAYNTKYMLDALKLLKKLKATKGTIYFKGPMTPLVIESDVASIAISPIRSY